MEDDRFAPIGVHESKHLVRLSCRYSWQLYVAGLGVKLSVEVDQAQLFALRLSEGNLRPLPLYVMLLRTDASFPIAIQVKNICFMQVSYYTEYTRTRLFIFTRVGSHCGGSFSKLRWPRGSFGQMVGGDVSELCVGVGCFGGVEAAPGQWSFSDGRRATVRPMAMPTWGDHPFTAQPLTEPSRSTATCTTCTTLLPPYFFYTPHTTHPPYSPSFCFSSPCFLHLILTTTLSTALPLVILFVHTSYQRLSHQNTTPPYPIRSQPTSPVLFTQFPQTTFPSLH